LSDSFFAGAKVGKGDEIFSQIMQSEPSSGYLLWLCKL